MEEIVNLFVNNSVAIAIIIYFCVRDWKFQNTLVVTLTTLVTLTNELKESMKKGKNKDENCD